MRTSLAAGLALLAVLVLTLLLATWEDPQASEVAGPAPALPAPETPGQRTAAVPTRPAAGDPGVPASPTLAAQTERRGAPAVEPSAPESSEEPLARGRVVDELGRPVAAATVQVRTTEWRAGLFAQRPEGPTSTTDSAGRFSCPAPLGPVVWLEVGAPGFAPLAEQREGERTGNELDLGTIALTTGAVLSGRVVDDLGRAVAQARILTVENESPHFLFGASAGRDQPLATSAADGSFRVDTLAPGPWHVLVLSDAHPEQEFQGRGEPADSTGVVLALPAGYILAGRVLSDGETPLDRIRIRAVPAEGLQVSSIAGARPWRDVDCAADGSFLVGGLSSADGLYEVRAHAGDASLFGADWRSAPVQAHAGERDLVLQLQPWLSITFLALDESGSRVSGCRVDLAHAEDGDLDSEELDSDDERLTLDAATGVCTVRQVRPPSTAHMTSLVLRREGFRSVASAPVNLAGRTTYDFGTLVLERRPQITVRVVELSSARPIPGARVELELAEWTPEYEVDLSGRVILGVGDGYEATTGADGTARLPRVEGLTFTLQATHEDYGPSAPREITLAAGERPGEPPIELSLAPGAEVEVLVVTPDGQPAPGFEVRAEFDDALDTRRSDREGRVRFASLSTALYRFTVRKSESLRPNWFRGDHEEAEGPHARTLQVQSGESYSLTLQRPALGTLFGRITEGGRPVAGATCRAEEQGAFFIPGLTRLPEVRTDSAGDYRLGPLDGGSYELVIEHPARVMSQRREVQVEEGPLRVDIELPLTSISGRAWTPDGLPLAGATITVEDRSGSSAGTAVSITLGTSGGGSVSILGTAGPSVQSDERGTFELRGLRTGTQLLVSATHPDFLEGRAAPLELQPGQRVEGLDLRLCAAGRLQVSVTGAGAGVEVVAKLVPDPAAGVEIAVDDDASTRKAETDASGEVLFSPLLPGTWTVTAHVDQRSSQPSTALVEAGATAALTLALP